MKEMNNKLFEGELTRCVPKQKSNNEKNFQSAGIMTDHLIMQGGPSFTYLCPTVPSLLVFGDKEKENYLLWVKFLEMLLLYVWHGLKK